MSAGPTRSKRGASLPVQTYPVVAENGDTGIRHRRYWLQVNDGYVDIFETREMKPEQGFSVRLSDLLGAIAGGE